MKITLRNIKHSKFASQETLCFEASIYVDGVRRGTVENSGRGECNHEHWIDRTFGEKVRVHKDTARGAIAVGRDRDRIPKPGSNY